MRASASAIDPARLEDFEAVRSLLRQVGLPPDGLDEHLGAILVARTDGRVVGCAALEIYSDGALLRSVAVDEDVRGTGLGQRLTRACLDLAGRRGVRQVYLLTETAAEFFARFGFRQVARSAVAPGVQGSLEFTSVCAESAVAMVLDLAGGAK